MTGAGSAKTRFQVSLKVDVRSEWDDLKGEVHQDTRIRPSVRDMRLLTTSLMIAISLVRCQGLWKTVIASGVGDRVTSQSGERLNKETTT